MGYGKGSIDDWANYINAWGKTKGWKTCLTPVDALAAKLALVHCEISEAVEALRDGKVDMVFEDGKPEGLVTEMADAVIRILHIDAMLREQGITKHSVLDAMRFKMEYNHKRAFRHGGKKL